MARRHARHSEKKAIEAAFNRSADELLRDIQKLRRQLVAGELAVRTGGRNPRNKTIGTVTEAKENGPEYERQIIPYLDKLEALKERHEKNINQIATRITAAVHASKDIKSRKQAKNLRRKLWLELAHALEPLSGRPSKKICALLINTKDELVAWDGNHLCPGIDRLPYLYVKTRDYNRGAHIWCAERNVLAKFLDVEAVMPSTTDLAAIHVALTKFTRSLIGAAINNDELKSYTLVSSHYPCVPCAEVIAPEVSGSRHRKGRVGVVKEILAFWNRATEVALTTPERRTKSAMEIFTQAGIKVRWLYRGCCPSC